MIIYEEPTWITEIKAAYPEVFQELIQYGFDCGSGWRDVILWALARMVAADPNVKVHQIKEKFGWLRINPQTDCEEVWRIVKEAEGLSQRICEVCGQPGTLFENRGITRCDACNVPRRS